MKKRILALLLMVCMLLTLVPVGAFAEEEGEDVQVLAEEGGEGEGEGGENNDSHEHTFGEWKDNGDGTCSKACTYEGCTETVTEAHSWGEWKHTDGTDTHSHTCSKCGATETKGCHGGTATCTEKAVCADCGAPYGSVKHSDTFNYKNADGNSHEIYCSICNEKLGVETCTFTEANCQAASACIKCHNTVGGKNPAKHIGGTKAVHNEGTETHNVVCEGCGTVIEENVPCTSDNTADCKHKSKCTACGGEVGELGGHKEGTPATCTTKAVCSVCGETYGNVLGHDLVNGVCTRIATGKCVCSTDHKTLWTAENASQETVQCPECGKTVEKESLTVAFTLSGYKVGEKIGALSASSNNSHVKVSHVSASIASRAGEDTFQAGTSYKITVEYTVDPGYKVTSATINAASASLSGDKVTASLGTLEMEYSISYDLDGGKLPTGKTNPATYTKSSSFTLVNPTKTGYDFAGWKGTGLDKATMDVTVPAGSTGSRSYTATWKIKSYTVTFDVQGHGTAPKAQTVEYGKKAATPKAPTEDGYAFGGWYKDAACKTKFSFSTKITGDITLYAKWDEAYTLKFHTNGGSTIKSINVAKNGTVNLKKYKPTRDGYSFVGWYRTKELKSGDQVSVQGMKDKYADENGVIHVYAKWKKMDTTNPKTGDTALPGLAVGLLALSAASLGAVAVISKKKRKW